MLNSSDLNPNEDEIKSLEIKNLIEQARKHHAAGRARPSSR
ncbi:MAG: hypothetical protein WBE18_04855 [Gammaproteobacteria bacterium]